MSSDGGMPRTYAPWVKELIGAGIPNEKAANCEACPMCAGEGTRQDGAGHYFRPDTKCCTYWPGLHNFLAGSILRSDVLVEGKERLRRQILESDNTTPLGVYPPRSYQLLYQDGGDEVFGRNENLRCPYYHIPTGGCTVWLHRNAVCATWFCKFDNGATGQRFWFSVRDLLKAVEQELSLWCLSELRIGSSAMSLLLENSPDGARQPRAIDPPRDEAQRRRLWGRWEGRVEEFYEECAKLVDPLRWADVLSICGPRVGALAALTKERWEALQDRTIPKRLSLGQYMVLATGSDGSRLAHTYRSTDPRKLSPKLYRLLGYFDGRPTEEIRAAIRQDKGVNMSDSLLRKLCDIELLVDPEQR